MVVSAVVVMGYSCWLRLRDVYDTLGDACNPTCKSGLQVGGVDAKANSDPSADGITHACLDCLGYGDAYGDADSITHTPCDRHAIRKSDTAPDAWNRLDHPGDSSGRAAVAAASLGPDVGHPAAGSDGCGQGLRDQGGQRMPYQHCESAMNRGLENWK